jgi:hypothetical protein
MENDDSRVARSVTAVLPGCRIVSPVPLHAPVSEAEVDRARLPLAEGRPLRIHRRELRTRHRLHDRADGGRELLRHRVCRRVLRRSPSAQ